MYNNLTKEEIELLQEIQEMQKIQEMQELQKNSYNRCRTSVQIFVISVVGSLAAFFIARKIFKW